MNPRSSSGCGAKRFGLVQIVMELLRPRGVAELGERLRRDLPDSLPVRWSSRPTYTAMSKSGGGHRWSRRKRPPSLAEIELSRTVVRRANNSYGSLGEAKP
jgi:hypothetical protein